MPALIAGNSNLHPLQTWERADTDGLDDEEMGVRTIFPFFISRRGKFLSVEECARIYRALNCEVSNLVSPEGTALQRQVAARCCHIGQPVAMPSPAGGIAGTLRISAGARVVSDTWCASRRVAWLHKLNEEFEQVRTILEKIEVLLENFEALDGLGEAHDWAGICDKDSDHVPSAANASTGAYHWPVVSPVKTESAAPSSLFKTTRCSISAGVRD
jgi:hypothetical protein